LEPVTRIFLAMLRKRIVSQRKAAASLKRGKGKRKT